MLPLTYKLFHQLVALPNVCVALLDGIKLPYVVTANSPMSNTLAPLTATYTSPPGPAMFTKLLPLTSLVAITLPPPTLVK